MKVLYVIESLGSGGKERRFVSLLKNLLKIKGFEAELILLSENVHYDSVFDLDVTIHYFKRDIRKDIKILNQFVDILNRFEPTVVHCWDNIAAVHFGPICKMRKIPFINSMISSAPLVKKWSKRYIAFSASYPFSDVILSNSLAGLESHHVPEKKRKVIYNGFDFSRMEGVIPKEVTKLKYGISKDLPIVGMVASFTSFKDYDSYIDAASMLNGRCSFLAIGNGPNLEASRKKADELNIENFHFLGRISDVESVVNIMDVGVLMSNAEEHGEGISNSIMEYMAFSKPVVASEGGGTSELVINGETGVLIPPGSPGLLAQSIERLLNEPLLAEKMGRNGRERIENRFSIDMMVRETYQLYSEFRDED